MLITVSSLYKLKIYFLRYKSNIVVTKNFTQSWGANKLNKSVKLKKGPMALVNPNVEEQLKPFRERVLEQGNVVRNLKAENASELDIKKAVAELKVRKKLLEDMESQLCSNISTLDRLKMEDVLKRRFFYDQSFAIYGGITGQYDYGPMGCALKSNIIDHWRKFFCLEEQLLEVDCSILTPEQVLKASGHVDRFADLMVKDMKNGECFRLDHLIKNHLEKILLDKTSTLETKAICEDIMTKLEGMSKENLRDILRKYDMKSPITNNDLSDPIEFNLMFATQIGPTGLIKGFLRPETAQGIFVNFKRLLEFNQGKLPFAVAQIGNAFRNEISPRSGLLRVREFTMAEIEHFCDPENKNHPKFDYIADTILNLYSACNQMDGKCAKQLSVGEAVKNGLIANETLGYYLARIHTFLLTIGIKPDYLRFRQHMENEMAHYACDCWDAECLTSYGWVECVGCADRSAYDLKQHMAATGVKLVAEKRLQKPKSVNVSEIVVNKQNLGKLFKKDSKKIFNALEEFCSSEIKKVEEMLEKNNEYCLGLNGNEYKLSKDIISVKHSCKTLHVEEIVPSVVEPSFGIGRILYSVLEHNFKIRDLDEQRCYFSLPPRIAPFKCSILPLSNNPEFQPIVKELSIALTKSELTHKVDDSSGSIGRRYARTDEIAIPYGITIDFDTLKQPFTVTLRERDSMEQVRIPLTEVPGIVKKLTFGNQLWNDILKIYPRIEQQQTSK